MDVYGVRLAVCSLLPHRYTVYCSYAIIGHFVLFHSCYKLLPCSCYFYFYFFFIFFIFVPRSLPLTFPIHKFLHGTPLTLIHCIVRVFRPFTLTEHSKFSFLCNFLKTGACGISSRKSRHRPERSFSFLCTTVGKNLVY